MFNKKYIALFLALTFVFTLSSAIMAHGGGNNDGHDNNYEQGSGMMNDDQYEQEMMDDDQYQQGMMGNGSDFNKGWNNSIGHQFNQMMGTMMGHGMMGFNNYGSQNRRFGMMNNYDNFMNDYGPGVNNQNYSLRNINMSRNEVIEISQKLVSERYGDQFEVVEMVVYSNSPYYLVVRENNQKEAAFGLMFDPVRKVVYPEYGPNMMWNRNYGMGFMMGWNERTNRSQIDRKEALENARNFASNNGLRVRDNGYQFSGYYSFYVENEDQPVGLISVNAYSGEVWAHNWHGNLIEIIEAGN